MKCCLHGSALLAWVCALLPCVGECPPCVWVSTMWAPPCERVLPCSHALLLCAGEYHVGTCQPYLVRTGVSFGCVHHRGRARRAARLRSKDGQPAGSRETVLETALRAYTPALFIGHGSWVMGHGSLRACTPALFIGHWLWVMGLSKPESPRCSLVMGHGSWVS